MAHAHLPASMGLTLAGERPDAGALPKPPPCSAPSRSCRSARWGASSWPGRIAAAFVEDPGRAPVAVILERHGAVAVGDEPDTAVDRLELVEVLCRAWRDALLVRAAQAILAERLAPASSGPESGASRRLAVAACRGRAGRGRGRVEHRKPPSALRQPARAHLPFAHVDERWFLDPAADRTRSDTGAEPAAGRDVRGVRRFADQDRAARPFALCRWLRGRRDRDKRPGIRVLRLRMTRSAGPISMILPRYITAIRSAMTHASDRSWVMNR